MLEFSFFTLTPEKNRLTKAHCVKLYLQSRGTWRDTGKGGGETALPGGSLNMGMGGRETSGPSHRGQSWRQWMCPWQTGQRWRKWMCPSHRGQRWRKCSKKVITFFRFVVLLVFTHWVFCLFLSSIVLFCGLFCSIIICLKSC